MEKKSFADFMKNGDKSDIPRLAAEDQREVIMNTPKDPIESVVDTEGVLEIEKEFVRMWDNGEFMWNYHKGDEIGSKEINPWRIWTTFIKPTLTAERAKAEKLWDLLDEIDTLPDALHPNTIEAHERCWKLMVETAKKRHKILSTDGYTLTPPTN